MLAGAVAGAVSAILWQPVDAHVRKVRGGRRRLNAIGAPSLALAEVARSSPVPSQKLVSHLRDVTGSRHNATALIATADVAAVVAVEAACFSLGLEPIFCV